MTSLKGVTVEGVVKVSAYLAVSTGDAASGAAVADPVRRPKKAVAVRPRAAAQRAVFRMMRCVRQSTTLQPAAGVMCPMYFDPIVVTVNGVREGRSVSYERTFGNPCVKNRTCGLGFGPGLGGGVRSPL
ncbi:SSI family serine proteinase inhibitor [Streptomyces sp. NPDC053367]|uniref:SSI family serine proteinase inhibitor n=1 Tax=Streptomyces sp. NPDC053367 TaxID=3365700 RepID=UPI0037D1497B